MKKLQNLIILALIGVVIYDTVKIEHIRGWAPQLNHETDYTHAAVECLLQQDGQAENDIEILFKGFKSREAYEKQLQKQYPGLTNVEKKREVYNTQIPECLKFFSEYRCWMLDIHNPKSLDACGKNFGLLQSEIDEMKKNMSNRKKVSELSDKALDRMRKEDKEKHK